MSRAPICAICQESICGKPVDNDNGDNEEDFPVTTRCGHFYHNVCIRGWFGSGAASIQNNGTRCPYCNKTVSKTTGLIRVYPVTEKDEVSILVPNLNEAPPPPMELDGEGFDQICLLSTRNDELAEENQCLQEILGSTEQENQVLRKQLKGAQDKLTKVKDKKEKLKLENVNLKAIAAAAEGNPSNLVVSSSRQPKSLAAAIRESQPELTQGNQELIHMIARLDWMLENPRINVGSAAAAFDLGCLRLPSPFYVSQNVVLTNSTHYGQVKCLLRDIATSNVFVGVEFDTPISGGMGMSGNLGTLQIFTCNEGHGLIVLASALSPLFPTMLTNVVLHSKKETNSGLIRVSSAAIPFQLEKETHFNCILTDGSARTLLGKVKCHLVDLATFEVIIGVQFREPVDGGMSGEIAGVQLFPCRQNHGRLIRATGLPF